MNDRDIELMDQYIYQVIRRLPKDQRDDVSMELRELIGDMAEEKGSVREALIALGDPAEFAKKYAGDSRYVIGPLYYDKYWKVLKIALACVVIAVFSIQFTQGIVEGYDPGRVADLGSIIGFITRLFSTTLANTISSAIGIFGTVTIVFMIMEYYKVDLDEGKSAEWSVDDLPKTEPGAKANTRKSTAWTPDRLTPVPDKKALLPRGDSIADIIFSVVLGALMIFVPHVFGVLWIEEDVITNISIFNLEKWDIILPFILISLLAGLTDAILRVIIGRYNLKVMISNITSGIIQIICSVIIFKVLPIWNPDFSDQFGEFISTEFGPHEYATTFDAVWFSNIILGIAIFATLIEVGTTVYRTLRYGMSEKKRA